MSHAARVYLCCQVGGFGMTECQVSAVRKSPRVLPTCNRVGCGFAECTAVWLPLERWSCPQAHLGKGRLETRLVPNGIESRIDVEKALDAERSVLRVPLDTKERLFVTFEPEQPR